MKKFILLMLILLLILISNSTLYADKVEVELDIFEAIELAEENNNSLLKAELIQKKAELNYKKAQSQNKLNHYLSEEILAEKNYLSAENNYENRRAEIIKDLINQYFTIILDKKEIQSQELILKAEERLYKEMEKRFELSEVNRIDLLEQKNSFRDAEIKLEVLNDKLEQDLINLKNLLKLDNINFELVEVPKIDFWKITQKEALETGFVNSKELKTYILDIKLAEINNKVEQIEAAEIDKKIAALAITEAELALKEKKDNLESNIISAQLNLLQLENRIELEKQRLENNKNDYNRVKREYELGSASLTALYKYEASYYNQEFNYQNTLLDYYLAVEELADILNLKPGVIFSE
jgi:outer membrane protein TolC